MDIKYKCNSKDEIIHLEPYDAKDIMWKLISTTQSFYEVELLEYMNKCLSPRKSLGDIIDVGANIGNHSVYFGKFLAQQLISIEANPDMIATLTKNLKANINNFVLYDCAVGEEDGYGKIIIPDGVENNFGSAQVKIIESQSGIKIRTIDAIVAEYESNKRTLDIAMMKVDVEGMEIDVLKGAVQTIKAHRPHLFLEAITPKDKEIIDNYLAPLGYKSVCRFCATPVYHYVYNPSKAYIVRAKFRALYSKVTRKLAG
jgi:FkbM family methyltransferase